MACFFFQKSYLKMRPSVTRSATTCRTTSPMYIPEIIFSKICLPGLIDPSSTRRSHLGLVKESRLRHTFTSHVYVTRLRHTFTSHVFATLWQSSHNRFIARGIAILLSHGFLVTNHDVIFFFNLSCILKSITSSAYEKKRVCFN